LENISLLLFCLRVDLTERQSLMSETRFVLDTWSLQTLSKFATSQVCFGLLVFFFSHRPI